MSRPGIVIASLLDTETDPLADDSPLHWQPDFILPTDQQIEDAEDLGIPYTGPGTSFPAVVDDEVLFNLRWRWYKLRMRWDLVFTNSSTGAVEPYISETTITHSEQDDAEAAFKPVEYYAPPGGEPSSFAVLDILYDEPNSQLLPGIGLSIIAPNNGGQLVSILVREGIEQVPTFLAPTVVCYLFSEEKTMPVYHYDPQVSVTGTINIEVAPVGGWREMTGKDGAPLYDKDTGEKLITPTPEESFG